MGEIFIGRRSYLEELGQDFFVTDAGEPGRCYSLVGPNDIGKTLLVRKLAEEFEKKEVKDVYYFDLKIIAEPKNFFWIFWTDAVMRMSEVITQEKMEAAPQYKERPVKDILKIYAFFNDEEQLNKMGTNGFDMEAKRYLEKIFKLYTMLGIHIILTIDEFDLARVAVPEESGDGSFFQRLFSLSPKGASRLNLSIMLISRRRLGTIAHHMTGGSSIDSAYTQIPLRGFDNEELEEYFQTYAEFGYELTEQEKRGILYFCGRHPGLLMHMRKAISRTRREGELNIGEVFVRQAPMKAVYDRMVELMKTEYVDSARTKDCIGPFAQVFIGPVYEEEERLPSYMEAMFGLGFLTRIEPGTKDIFELVGADRTIGLSEKQRKFLGYEPLSPYFVEYFKNCVLPSTGSNVITLLFHTEEMVRTMILEVLREKFPATPCEEVLEEFSAKKDGFLQNLQETALKNDAPARNISCTIVDVMSFRDYAKIIEKYWDVMSPRLPSFDSSASLEADFSFIAEARNCYAHANARVLKAGSVAHLEELCKKLCDDLEVSPECEEKVEEGGKAIFRCTKEKAEKGLKGVLKGTLHKAVISKDFVERIKNSVGRENLVGCEFEVTVVGQGRDGNADCYVVAPVAP